jgi:predicted acylesterase/phospholipase RssA
LTLPVAPAGHKVALVIGSGGLKCSAAYGVMTVLQREGIPVDMVVACSGGAFCGVWVADGATGDAQAESARFAQGWEGTFDRRSWRGIAKALFPRVFGFNGALGLIPDVPFPVGLRDTSVVPRLFERGVAAAEREIPYLRKLLGVPAPAAAMTARLAEDAS